MVAIDVCPSRCAPPRPTPAAQQLGGVRVSKHVRPERDSGPLPDPADQVIDTRVGHRTPDRTRPQVDEHVVAVQVAVLGVQVIGVEPDHPRRHRHLPAASALGPRPIRIPSRHYRDQARCGVDVAVPQPQRFTDPQPALAQQGEQKPVPQPITRGRDRRDLLSVQRVGDAPLGSQTDPPGAFRSSSQVRQQRPPRSAACPASLPGRQQITKIHAVALMELVERRDRRQLPVHRRLRAATLHRRQRGDVTRPRRRGQPQPRHEPAHVLQPHPRPLQPALIEELEPVPQIVRIGLDRVR